MTKHNPGIVTTVKSTMKNDRALSDAGAAKARQEFGSYAAWLRIIHRLYIADKLKVASVVEDVVITDRDTGDEG